MEPITLESSRVLLEGKEAALLDIGDGIGCLQFRSKGNSITPSIKAFITDVLSHNLLGLQGMVIGNEGKNFSVGANLQVMKRNLDRQDFSAFDTNVRTMQTVTMALKHYHKPIVAACQRRTLGGGLEIALHCHGRVVTDEFLAGLVEVGMGLLPAGGGTKECALLIGHAPEGKQSQVIRTVFEKLILRTVSFSAGHAQELLYLTNNDEIVKEREYLLARAKTKCLSMVQQGIDIPMVEHVTLPGKSSYTWMVEYADQLANYGTISSYDAQVGRIIARILAGSDTSGPAEYSEEQLLNLEREGFVYLAKQKGTFDRITYFTEHNRLLRN